MNTASNLTNQAIKSKKRYDLNSSEEGIIAKDASESCKYARFVLESRFVAAEANIAENANAALYYATFLLNDRFKLAESYIAENVDTAYTYSKDVLNGRFKQAEDLILESALASEYVLLHRNEFSAEEMTFLKMKHANI